MALFIRDADVDALAVELQRVTKAPSKTAAVRAALEHELNRQTQARPLLERLRGAHAKAEAMGFRKGQGTFDMKAFTDEGWGE